MSTLAGIDLGTTYSAVAVLNDLGKPEIIPDNDSNRIIPSVVGFSSENSAVVGVAAKNLLVTDPKDVIQFVKRKMGNPSFKYNVKGRSYTPIDISALILKKIKEECIQNGEIRDVVITVPAHFDEVQRKSTMDAGTIAGLNVLGIINEPTAAALYYASIAPINGNVVVYDLGGGTFDVTIISMNGANVEVLTSKGDGHLGGVDFDNEIVKFINEKAIETYGAELFPSDFLERRTSNLPKELELLYNKVMSIAEKTKKTLSVRNSASIRFVSPLGNLSMELTKDTFEERISSYIATTEMLVENALEDAKLRASDISKVLLVGGSTRIPCVVQSLTELFGFAPEKAVNVDEAVALGAAISAGVKKVSQSGGRSVPAVIRAEIAKTTLLEACNKNFGTLSLTSSKITGKKVLENCIILPKNTKIPCSVGKDFFTVIDNQERVKIEITESEEEETDPDNVNVIGSLLLDLPPNTPEDSCVRITYGYDENQRLDCSVMLPDGETYRAVIGYDESGNLTQSEIEKKQATMNDFVIE